MYTEQTSEYLNDDSGATANLEDFSEEDTRLIAAATGDLTS